jgi:hypothetical protein
MCRPSLVRLFAALLIAGAVASPSSAHAQRFCRGFGYGNFGSGAGYSIAVGRGWGWGYGGGYACLPRVSCWRPYRPLCGVAGYSFGWPGYGFGGWSGCSTYYGSQSVYLATPFGGGASFFSGGIVPCPVPYAVPYAVPYVAPWVWFGGVTAPAASAQATAAARAPNRAAAQAAAPRDPVAIAQAGPAARLRAAHPAARRRAAALVAAADRQLLEAGDDARLLRAAANVYRRAAAAAADDPDIHIRHAIALDAAGRPADADAAARRAVALDGRLDPERGNQRGPDEAPPLLARGAAILREIAAADPEAEEPLARLAAAWAARAAGPLARLAAVSGSR